jgi:uncharacterized RDD family membrane protein YckC
MDSDEKYQTGWRRLGSAIVDGIILGFFYWLISGYFNENINVYKSIIYDILEILYLVSLTYLYGATVGKKLLGVEVVDNKTGGKIFLRQAILRESGLVALVLVSVCLSLFYPGFLSSGPTDAGHLAYEYFEFGAQFWFLLEMITMLSNKKRRAIHDYIAGTVVVLKKSKVNGQA